MSAAVTSIDDTSLKGWSEKPWAHLDGCECGLDQTFTCDRCGRRFGDCLGMADQMPGACDFCWGETRGWAIRWRDRHGRPGSYLDSGDRWVERAPFHFYPTLSQAVTRVHLHWGCSASGPFSSPILVRVTRRETLRPLSARWKDGLHRVLERKIARGSNP